MSNASDTATATPPTPSPTPSASPSTTTIPIDGAVHAPTKLIIPETHGDSITVVAVNSAANGTHTHTHIHAAAVNGAAHPNTVSANASEEDEGDDQFDVANTTGINQHSPRSPSPHSSQSHKYGLSTSHSFYTAAAGPVPDVLSNIDRTLLSIIAPFNYYDSATLSQRLSSLAITKTGYLYKRQSQPLLGGNRYRYNKRYVAVKENHLRYDSGKKALPMKGDIDLRQVTVNHDKCEMNPDLLILDVNEWHKLQSPNVRQPQGPRCMEWRCDSEAERQEWIRVIEESKMLHEVYPLKTQYEPLPFPVALILGLPASGKSTVFKHVMAWRPASMAQEPPQPSLLRSYSSLAPRVGEEVKVKIPSPRNHPLHEPLSESEGYMATEVRLAWKKRVYLHVLRALCVLADHCDEHDVSSDFVYAHHVLSDQEQLVRVNEDEHLSLDSHTVDYVNLVWLEPLVKHAYQRLCQLDPYVRTLKYFLDKLSVILSNDWIPSFTDVYHCYHPLSIMTWKQIDSHSPHRFRVYDIGGSQPMDRVDKWKLERFLTASFVIYTVDLNSYAKPATVDPSLTLLTESLLLYQQLLTNDHFRQWGPIHVYFTGADLLKDTLLSVPFSERVTGYSGDSSKGSVIRTQMAMFAKVGGDRYIGRAVSGLDRNEMRKSINEDIERRREQMKKRFQKSQGNGAAALK